MGQAERLQPPFFTSLGAIITYVATERHISCTKALKLLLVSRLQSTR